MANQTRASWLVYALGALCVATIVAAFLLVGPQSQSATVQSRIVKAQRGVVQSTVSGNGTIQPATQLDLGFKTAGVVQRIYVAQGAQVTTGKLLAELNPQSAEVTLEQAKASLQAAEATLAQEEEDGGETSSAGQSDGAGASAKAASVSAVPSGAPTTTVPAATSPAPSTTTAPVTTSTTTAPAPSTSAPSRTPSATTPAKTTPAKTTPGRSTVTTTPMTTPSTTEKTKRARPPGKRTSPRHARR